MTKRRASIALPALWLCVGGLAASAQTATTTTLPRITVTGSPYTEHHGGYLISGDFKVDPRMPCVAFPARDLVEDDILSVQPIRLNDDEYLVLQECALADCSRAHVVRVWGANGALTPIGNSDYRVWITHENKYFIWLMRLPDIPSAAGFTQFLLISPPLMLIPTGRAAALHQLELQDQKISHPIPVKSYQHEGATFVVTYASGSVVRIRRMHAAEATQNSATK
ncbi:MAG TPA: hypothetical protein VJ862_04615 [Rhodanobacteraceae bacterium]|nr:hypothetical protein [Rhodanobacteraceae bacterium]